MADIVRAPLVCCDNCGKQDVKELRNKTEWRKPATWGHVRVAPKHFGAYPDNIDLLDLCPKCNSAVHDAVSAALDKAKKTQTKEESTDNG